MVRMPQRVIVSLGLLCALSSGIGTAYAQDKATLKSLDSRLARVERVMDQSLLEQLQRVDALQREIRSLRGEIESLNHQVNTLKKRSNDLYADTDQRITDLEEAQDALDLSSAEGGLSEASSSDTAAASSTASSPATPAPVIVKEGERVVPPNNLAEFGDGPKPPTGPLRDTASQAEKAGYTRAYDLLARGQNESAVRSFAEFLISFPDGPYSDNAWYWQGEAMYAQRNFDAALRNFGVVVNSFPDSPKVPDARLKIGFALYEQQNYSEARAILTGVQDDYPGRSAAVLARKRLQKMNRDGL